MNTLFPVHNDSGQPLILRLAGALVGKGGIGDTIPATPVLSHTSAKPYLIKGGWQNFGGNGGGIVDTPVGHGLPQGAVPIAFCAMGVGFAAVPFLTQSSDGTFVYLGWAAINNSTFAGGTIYSFEWMLLAQLT